VRSIWAILAGFIVSTVLAFGARLAVATVARELAATPYPASDTSLLLVLVLCIAAVGVVGSYITARLAPRRPMMHAVILGMISLVIVFAASTFDWAESPAWYHVLTVLLVLPAALLGGRLYDRPGRRRASAMARSR